MCKLVELLNSKDWQEPGCKQFEFSSYTVAVQLPPQQQSRQDHSFYVVHYIALCGQFLLEQDSLVLIVTSPEEITYLLATFA